MKEVMNALQLMYTIAKMEGEPYLQRYNEALDTACNMFGTEAIAEELMKRKMV